MNFERKTIMKCNETNEQYMLINTGKVEAHTLLHTHTHGRIRTLLHRSSCTQYNGKTLK